MNTHLYIHIICVTIGVSNERNPLERLKNARLKRIRGVSFEEILRGKLIETVDHPARIGQSILLIEYEDYVWVVPFVKTETGIFLKTVYPSRKYTKRYWKGEL